MPMLCYPFSVTALYKFGRMTLKTLKHFSFDEGQKLGEGSTGIVYLGTDLRNRQPIAVKAIDLNNIDNEVTKYLLKNEVKALQIVNHPNVLKAIDVIQGPEFCYVITEYLPNGTLAEYIEKRGFMEEDEALLMFKQLVDGYDHIFDLHIYHRDLKPHNVLLDANMRPVLSDFGYCEITGFLQKPKLKYNVGSPGYMAPQSIVGNLYSQNSEVWSLGTILYEMMTGKNYTNGRPVMEAVMLIKKQGPYFPDNCSEFTKMIIRESMKLKPEERMKVKTLKKLLQDYFNSKPKQPTQSPSMMSSRCTPMYPLHQNQHNGLAGGLLGQTQQAINILKSQQASRPGAIVPNPFHLQQNPSQAQLVLPGQQVSQQQIPFITMTKSFQNYQPYQPQGEQTLIPPNQSLNPSVAASARSIQSISTSLLPVPFITPMIQEIIQTPTPLQPQMSKAVLITPPIISPPPSFNSNPAITTSVNLSLLPSAILTLPTPPVPSANNSNIIRNVAPKRRQQTNYNAQNKQIEAVNHVNQYNQPGQFNTIYQINQANQVAANVQAIQSIRSHTEIKAPLQTVQVRTTPQKARPSSKRSSNRAIWRSNVKNGDDSQGQLDSAPFYMPNLNDSMDHGHPTIVNHYAIAQVARNPVEQIVVVPQILNTQMPTPQLGQQPIVQVSLQGMQSPSQVKMSQVVAPPVVIPVPNPHNVIPLITNTQPTTTSSHLRNNSAQSAPFNPYGFNMMGQNFNPHLLKGSFGQNQPVQYPLPSQMAPSYPSTIAPRQNTHYIR